MKKLLLLSCLVPMSAQASSWFNGHVNNMCSNKSFKCDFRTAEKVRFRMEGDGYRKVFTLDKDFFDEMDAAVANDWYIKKENPGRIDYLKQQKIHYQIVNGSCAGALATCGFAMSRMMTFWPGLVLTFSCTTGATVCMVITDDKVDEIKEEIKRLQENQAGSSGPSHSTSHGPELQPNIPPMPLPEGIVTINDNPRPLGGSNIP